MKPDTQRLEAWLQCHDGKVSARVVALDHFRVTLKLSTEVPDWVHFGRSVRWGFIAGEESISDVPVTIARVPAPGSRSTVVVAQIRVLSPTQVSRLEQILGFVPIPPVPPPRVKSLRRPKAPPRPLPPHERRAHPRYVVNMDLWVTHDSVTHIMRVRDISRGGMLCEIPLNDTADWVVEGSRLKMKLFPPDLEPLEFKGRIVRVMPRTNRRLASFGVAFDNVACQILMGRLLQRLRRAAA